MKSVILEYVSIKVSQNKKWFVSIIVQLFLWLDFQQSITKLPWQLPFTEKTLCQMTACKKVFFGKVLENYCIMQAADALSHFEQKWVNFCENLIISENSILIKFLEKYFLSTV